MTKQALTINQVAKLCGITVRTLHYYDEIGLLHPTDVAENGYRLYDEKSLEKLQEILFFKELDIPLKEIKLILNNPSYDKHEALSRHKELLKLKRDRLDRIINLVDENLSENKVNLKEFDMSEIKKHIDKYAQETKERWGNTSAYKQSQKKTSKYSDEDWKGINEDMDRILAEFAACMNNESGCKDANSLIKEWQRHITKYFYDCTDEILLGLADMYKYDERFRANMDKHGEGVTDFISKSIREYVQNKRV